VVLTTPPRKKLFVTKPHMICEEAKVLQELYSHRGGGGGGGSITILLLLESVL
jgi:hypothetical protein